MTQDNKSEYNRTRRFKQYKSQMEH